MYPQGPRTQSFRAGKNNPEIGTSIQFLSLGSGGQSLIFVTAKSGRPGRWQL